MGNTMLSYLFKNSSSVLDGLGITAAPLGRETELESFYSQQRLTTERKRFEEFANC